MGKACYSLIGRCLAILVLGCALPYSPALAQYTYDPSNLDEQGPGIKYFGSVKDERGALLKGAVVVIAKQYMLVTDNQGRFRQNLPPDLPGENVDATCSLPGYQPVRVMKRRGPNGPKQTVQVDCVMRPLK